MSEDAFVSVALPNFGHPGWAWCQPWWRSTAMAG